MNYKNIETEIDELLRSGGLNPYERKFLKKIKRHLSQKNDRLKRAVSLMLSFRASSDQNAERGEKLCLILSGKEREEKELNKIIRELEKLRDKDKQRLYALAAFSLVMTTAFLITLFYPVFF